MTSLPYARALLLAAGLTCAVSSLAWGQNPPRNAAPGAQTQRVYGPPTAAQLQAAQAQAASLTLSAEAVAGRISATTVTVRVTYPVADPNVVPGANNLRGANPAGTNAGGLPANAAAGGIASGANTPPGANPPVANPPGGVPPALSARLSRTGVAVASGVSLGKKAIVSFLSAPATSRIRITLPDGASADARPVVVDHYSGLTLLEIDQEVTGLPLSPQSPAVGGTVYTAAGAGAEEPLLSKGILSGTPRAMGSLLPPVLPCDVRISSSSSGAPLVDQTGRLIGIVAGSDPTGWAYAIPVEHVERLLKSRPASGVVVLERRQPVLGLILNPGVRERAEQPPTVEVARVIAGGPAEKAGFQTGDLVAAVDGKPVRILYDVSKAVLSKQPGDHVQFLVRRNVKANPAPKADPNNAADANAPQVESQLRLTIELGGAGDPPRAVAKLDERLMIGVAQPFAGSRMNVQVPSVVISTSIGSKTGAVSAPLSISITPAGEEGVEAEKPVAPSEVERLRMQLNQLQADVARRDREIALLKLQLEAWAKALQAYQKLKPREAGNDEAPPAESGETPSQNGGSR